jgi:hypothetical protein
MNYTGQQFGKLTINECGNELINQLIASGETEQQAKIEICGRDAIALALSNHEALFSSQALLDHLCRYVPSGITIKITSEGILLDNQVVVWCRELPKEIQLLLTEEK